MDEKDMLVIFKATGLGIEERRGIGMNSRAMLRDRGEERTWHLD